jgi:hypothetical protein
MTFFTVPSTEIVNSTSAQPPIFCVSARSGNATSTLRVCVSSEGA